MANMFKMMKDVMQMRSQMKQIEKSLAKKTVTFNGVGVKIVARADMSIESITFSPEALDPARIEKFEKNLVNAVNGALSTAKKEAAEEMQKLTGGMGGLAEMMGG